MAPVLACQGCGAPMWRRTPDQERAVARNPFRHVLRCDVCGPEQAPEPEPQPRVLAPAGRFPPPPRRRR